MTQPLKKHHVIARLNAIHKGERCDRCAGFGRVFSLSGTTHIFYRSFGNLQRHMKTKHPQFNKDDGDT